MKLKSYGSLYEDDYYLFPLMFKYSGGKQHLQQGKTSISPSNVALNTNPGTVLKSACPEDSKTPLTC